LGKSPILRRRPPKEEASFLKAKEGNYGKIRKRRKRGSTSPEKKMWPSENTYQKEQLEESETFPRTRKVENVRGSGKRDRGKKGLFR